MQADNYAFNVLPPLKRRRIEKACDDCRRLKTKCDGLTPCTHCATYEFVCTYNKPNRRPKAPAQYARELEDRLQVVERLLKVAYPSLDLDDILDPAHGISEILQTTGSTAIREKWSSVGEYDHAVSHLSESDSLPAVGMQQKAKVDATIPLPSKEVAYDLLVHALHDACVLHVFVHEPLFYLKIDCIYETPAERLVKDHRNMLALFYAALALGTFFADGTGSDKPDGSFYFKWALRFLDIDKCQDLVSLQALCFLVIFLQSSGQLEKCYMYVGVALRSAVALNLHRRSIKNANSVEHEIGRRVFWVLWRMDIYSSSMLGIPPMLSTEFVDQSIPQPFNNTNGLENITSLPSAESNLLLAGGNAHTKLTLIMPKVMRLVKVFKKRMPSSKISPQDLIDRSGVLDIEQQLQTWFRELPSELLSGGETTSRLERVRQLLRIAYCYVQMVLYEPLVQLMPKRAEGPVDPQVFDYVMKYATVTRNIVNTGVLIHKTHVANYSSRSTMISTTYAAILSLLAFILNSSIFSGTKGVIFREALEGRETLEELSSRSKLADQYVQKLNFLLKNFQDKPAQPLHLSVWMPPIPGIMTPPPVPAAAADAIEEPLSSQTITAAPELSETALQSEFVALPRNFVFEPPYHAPSGDTLEYASASTSFFQPDSQNTDPQISLLDMLCTTHPRTLDYHLINEQNFLAAGNLIYASPRFPTSDAMLLESSALEPPMFYPESELFFPE